MPEKNKQEVIDFGEFVVENEKDKEVLKRYILNIMDGDTYHKPAGLKPKTKKQTAGKINEAMSGKNAIDNFFDNQAAWRNLKIEQFKK